MIDTRLPRGDGWTLRERHTVLCVDDERPVLDALARLLRLEPYDLVVTERPEEALERIESRKISLLIADQRMPEMSGTELLKSARDRAPETTRVILTGYADLGSVTDAINSGGVQRYLNKPWNETDLKLTIRQLLHERELEKSNQTLEWELAGKNRELSRLNHDLEGLLQKQTWSLRISQEVLDLLTMPVAVVVPQEDGVSYHNKAFLHLLAGRKSSLRGCSLEAIFPLEVRESIQSLLQSPGECTVPEMSIGGRSADFRLASIHGGERILAVLIQVVIL